MKMTINSEYRLQQIFAEYGRDYYSLDGYEFMLDFYGEDFELDVIGICGDLTEYGDHASLSFRDFISDEGSHLACGGYSYHQMNDLTDDEIEEAVDELVETLSGYTYCQKLKNGDVIMLAY